MKWLEAVLPYASSLDPEATGKLARALLPELMKVCVCIGGRGDGGISKGTGVWETRDMRGW